jgi:glutaredoxin
MYKMYTKDNCPWCVKAKQLLNSCGVQYKELKLGVDYQREDLQALLPKSLPLTVPQVFVYNKRVGGYEDLAEYLETHGVLGTQQ